ncbi:MAG: hypothetical protein QF578_21380 [Alphaproteobacteria bacterium]|jgi:3-hydroxy-9,10-secoandrosta-1,3,5(10)-triene-9,17-dione monooxygenase|nr:hypothetical protein [Alphaproteobacteria bacterium]MDP6567396.1 hypothetical protein [Alphaproteobacteria bacterium]MDP6814836.1 hypothetical protein [Alphaproteobacteria bacterium]
MIATIEPPGGQLSGPELIARAAALVPILRERANSCEDLRRVPDETVRDFLEAGLYRIVQPRCFGGYEQGLPVMVRCMMEVARGCPSSAWVLCLTAAHTWWAALYPAEAQAEVFGDDGDLRFPLIFAPTGQALPVDGGYRLDGTWNYASGCDNSNWLGVNALIPPAADGRPPAPVMCLIRADDYRVNDNWHVMGLRGTGSKQAVAEGVFVPERRALVLQTLDEAPPPGAAIHDNPFYRGPAGPIFFAEIASIAVGIAKGAVEAFDARARVKTTPFKPGVLLFESEAARGRLARATAMVDAAEAMLLRQAETYMEMLATRVPAGQTLNLEERARMQLQLQHVVEESGKAVELLFVAGGTSAMNDGEPLQRYFRDISALRTHYLMDGDRVRDNWGRLNFGLEPSTRTPGV